MKNVRFWATGIEPINGFTMTPITKARDAVLLAGRLAEDEQRAEMAQARIRADITATADRLRNDMDMR